MKYQDYPQKHILIYLLTLLGLSIVRAQAPAEEGRRISDKIYTKLQSDHYCSRRLNATHQMGCSSELGGNNGVTWIVDSESDLDHILKTGPTPPYIAVLRRDFYSIATLLDFKAKPHRVAGVVFIDDKHDEPRSSVKSFSPEDRCPNRYSGLYVNNSQYNDCKENTWVHPSPITGLLYEDIPYPIFLINAKDSIDAIESCFKENYILQDVRIQASYPLCSMQLDSFMMAASDTNMCINSHSLVDELLQTDGTRCADIRANNIFAYLRPAHGKPHESPKNPNYQEPDSVAPQSVVLLTTKLSSLSMFTDISPGADSTLTGIITMLAAAEFLGKFRNNSKVNESSRNIAFAFLDSEPFDYTGSSSITYSMQENTFPNRYFSKKDKGGNDIVDAIQNINLTAFDYVIDIDQVAAYPASKTMYLHTEPNNGDSKKQSRVTNVFERLSSDDKVILKLSKPNLPLPPTPVQEFIKHSQGLELNKRLFGLVLSNYDDKFNNLYYNGIYDDTHNIYQVAKEELVEHISRVASLVARTALELAFNVDQTSDISVDRTLVAELLDCYLINASCNLFTKVWHAGQQLPKSPIQTYKDPVKQSDDMNGAISNNLLAYFIGDKIHEHNFTQCMEANSNSYIYNYQYVNGKGEPIKDGSSGVCVRSQVLALASYSPAFRRTTEGHIEIDTNYPAWSVSLNSIRNPVRIYMTPSPMHQLVVFLIGVFVTIAAFTMTYLIQEGIYRMKEEVEPTGTST